MPGKRKPIKGKLTVEQVRKTYRAVNRVYFFNSLPADIDIKVVKNIDGAHGETSRWTNEEKALLFYRIQFSQKLWDLGRRLVYVVLLHEMCHLAAGLENNHNKVFESNRRRLIKTGAYDNLL